MSNWGKQPVQANLKALKNETIKAVYFEHQDYKHYTDSYDINWKRDSTSNIKQKWKKTHVAALRWQTANFADIQAYQRRGNNNNDYKPNSQASKLARDLMNVLQQARRAPSKPKRTGNYKMLYRGITGAPAKKLLTEGVLVDKGFVATTPMVTIAEEYAQENTSGIIMRIAISSIPAGTPCMWIPQDFAPAMWMDYVQVVLPPGELILSKVQSNSKFVDVTYKPLPINARAPPNVRTLPINMRTLSGKTA